MFANALHYIPQPIKYARCELCTHMITHLDVVDDVEEDPQVLDMHTLHREAQHAAAHRSIASGKSEQAADHRVDGVLLAKGLPGCLARLCQGLVDQALAEGLSACRPSTFKVMQRQSRHLAELTATLCAPAPDA